MNQHNEIDNTAGEMQVDPQALAAFQARLTTYAAQLQAHGIHSVAVSYSGSSDETSGFTLKYLDAELRDVHRAVGAQVYTAHAGLRRSATMAQMIDNVRRMADFFEAPVAVEGHYPAKGDPFLMSQWSEWEQVLHAGVPFVVDVSHAQIVGRLGGGRRMDLLGEMLASDRCLEIHLSGNDGTRDQHRPMTGEEWWWPLMERATPHATLFYEGVAGRAKPVERPAVDRHCALQGRHRARAAATADARG